MSYTTQKLAVRDSFDEEDISDDVEDEVFIRDGRNGFRSDEERGVKRPLMAPKRKYKSGLLQSEHCKKNSWQVFCIPCCYAILALTALIGLIAGVVGLVLWLPLSMDQVVFWKQRLGSNDAGVVPCPGLQARDLWTRSFPKLTVESALVLSDVSGDGIADVIVGYGTGLDGREPPSVLCVLYFGRKPPCSGGVMALDGRSGTVIWRHWMDHSVYTVDCGADLTGDGVADCLAAGKGGVFHAVNGHDGSSVWEFAGDSESSKLLVNVYCPRFIHDVDADGVLDVLAVHTWLLATEAEQVLTGELVLLSGARGALQWQVRLPGGEEGYHSPQIIVHPDGEEFVVFGTGGQDNAGGLYIVSFASLMDMKDVKVLYKNPYKGIISPPVLADINKDGSEDIVVAVFNSSVLAFDGLTFKPLWNFSFPMSESLSPPTPGYFNDDDIPDFLVQYNIGPGFPTYFFSQTMVLDGQTGAPLLKLPIVHTLASQTPALTISLSGFGNDFLLYWAADCIGNEGATEPFSFLPGSSVQAQNNVDLCLQRFNSTAVSRLYALNQHVGSPGVVIYSSDDRTSLEYHNTRNASVEVEQYLASHPELQDVYSENLQREVEKKDWVRGKSSSSFRHKEEESTLVGDVFHERGRGRQEVDKRPSHDEQHQHRLGPDSWQPHQESTWYAGSPDYELSYEPDGAEEYGSQRDKRSRGPRFKNGIPRLTSAGVLATPVDPAARNSSIDVVFVTYWVPSSADAQVLSPAAKSCIEKKRSQVAGLYQPLTVALQECAGVPASVPVPDNRLEVQMGQMTVYRLHISCACLAGSSCVSILPLEKQGWPTYLGHRASAAFMPRYG